MNVIDIRGFTEDAVVGPQNGASRLFIWCTSVQAGEVVALHRHLGEELIRVLYGKLRFHVSGETREIGPGEVVIVEPGAVHGYITVEDADIEVYGEVGSGVFVPKATSDGSTVFDEVFIRDVPWSRTPPDDSLYITRAEQLDRFRTSYAAAPFA
jgi:quercetin dioxygenase-like cupin family protein